MIRQPIRPRFLCHLVLALLGAAFFLLPTASRCRAEQPVSCRYLQAEGQKITLRLDIGAPPPSMLILVQRLPAGTAIRAASPAMQRYDQATGEAKWLLKKLQPGAMFFTLELDQPVPAQAVSGEIRYKSPASETTVTMPIRP